MRTRNNLVPTLAPMDGWKPLFEAALLENDPTVLPFRLREAKDAVMGRIEDSFNTASLSERRLLIATLGAICELERRSDVKAPTSLYWSSTREAA